MLLRNILVLSVVDVLDKSYALLNYRYVIGITLCIYEFQSAVCGCLGTKIMESISKMVYL